MTINGNSMGIGWMMRCGIALLSVWTCMAAGYAGEPLTDSLLLRDYQYVSQADPWLGGYNAAALTRYRFRNISEAAVAVSYGKGGFVDYSQSRRAVDVSANVESFYRLSPQTVVYGKMSYESFSGRDMGGSVFINPSRLPFDIVEDSLTYNGKKHRDTYHLVGGVGVDLWQGIALGAKIDYTAANYAKYKDMRHQNRLMDMMLTTSLYVPIYNKVDVGASFYYQRKNEIMTYGVYGDDERVFRSLVNYGGFMGRVATFGPYGYTGSTFSKPLFELYRGWSVQTEVHLSSRVAWYHSFADIYRSGYYGRRSTYSNVYSSHHSDKYQYGTRLSYQASRSEHRLEGWMDIENLVNNEETYLEVTDDNGSSQYEYYDPVKASNKVWADFEVAYTGHFGITDDLPTWSMTAGARGLFRKQTAYDYPYYRRQRLHRTEWFVQGERNWLLGGSGVLNISLGGSFSKGSGRPYTDGTFAEPSSKQSSPPTMEAYLYREHAWLTAPQYAVNGSVKYTFVCPGTQMATFVKGSFSHRRSNTRNEYVIGRDHQECVIAVGCSF